MTDDDRADQTGVLVGLVAASLSGAALGLVVGVIVA